jgi:hypothetical protein
MARITWKKNRDALHAFATKIQGAVHVGDRKLKAGRVKGLTEFGLSMTIAEAIGTGWAVCVLSKVIGEIGMYQAENGLTLTEEVIQARFYPGCFLQFPTPHWHWPGWAIVELQGKQAVDFEENWAACRTFCSHLMEIENWKRDVWQDLEMLQKWTR